MHLKETNRMGTHIHRLFFSRLSVYECSRPCLSFFLSVRIDTTFLYFSIHEGINCIIFSSHPKPIAHQAETPAFLALKLVLLLVLLLKGHIGPNAEMMGHLNFFVFAPLSSVVTVIVTLRGDLRNNGHVLLDVRHVGSTVVVFFSSFVGW